MTRNPTGLPLPQVEAYVIDVFTSMPGVPLYRSDVHKLVDPAVLTSDPQHRTVGTFNISEALRGLTKGGHIFARDETDDERDLRRKILNVHPGSRKALVYSSVNPVPPVTEDHYVKFKAMAEPRPKNWRPSAAKAKAPKVISTPIAPPAADGQVDPRVLKALGLLEQVAKDAVATDAALIADLRVQVADRDELITSLKATLANERAKLKAIENALTAVRS
jgi:hypothetical protein